MSNWRANPAVVSSVDLIPYRRLEGRRARLLSEVVFLFVAVGLLTTPATAEDPSPASDCDIPLLDDRCETWVARPDSGGDDVAISTATSPDGSRVFLTGLTAAGQGADSDIVTVAFDAASGLTQWVARYGGAAHEDDIGMSVVSSADGGYVYVSGTQDSAGLTGASGDFVTLAYNAKTGAEEWVTSIETGNRAYASTLGPGQQGDHIYVTGTGISSGSDFYTIAIDGRNGEILWDARYNGPANGSDIPSLIEVGADGERVFVSGRSFNGSNEDWATVAYNSGIHDDQANRHGGEMLWSVRYDGAAGDTDTPYALEVGPDNGLLYVAGRTCVESALGILEMVGACDNDFQTVAYDQATGVEVWSTPYGGSPGAEPLDPLGSLTGAALTPDGRRLIVTGQSVGAGDAGVTISYEGTTGEQLWERRFPGNQPRWVAVSPDGGRVFVTGGDIVPVGLVDLPTGTYNWPGEGVTVAYDLAGGQQLWVARYRGAPSDMWAEPNLHVWDGAAVAPGGEKVYVARTFAHARETLNNESNSHDFGVVAYET